MMQKSHCRTKVHTEAVTSSWEKQTAVLLKEANTRT